MGNTRPANAYCELPTSVKDPILSKQCLSTLVPEQSRCWVGPDVTQAPACGLAQPLHPGLALATNNPLNLMSRNHLLSNSVCVNLSQLLSVYHQFSRIGDKMTGPIEMLPEMGTICPHTAVGLPSPSPTASAHSSSADIAALSKPPIPTSRFEGHIINFADGSRWRLLKALSHIKLQQEHAPCEGTQAFTCRCINRKRYKIGEAVIKIKFQYAHSPYWRLPLTTTE